MSWNDGYERRKFEARQKKQAEEYRALGMTEEQIQAMYSSACFFCFASNFFVSYALFQLIFNLLEF